MKRKIRITFILLLVIGNVALGQLEGYKYARTLDGISEQWHKIVLPNDIFGEVSQDFKDVRIIGITAANDTIEVPYFWQIRPEGNAVETVSFEVINTSKKAATHFFTLKIPSSDPVNQINLGFDNRNFDWRLKLEGSQDQNQWFTILEDYRILSIKNDRTDYDFTELNFPVSQYGYYRISFDSAEKPRLSTAAIAQYVENRDIGRTYVVKDQKRVEDKKEKKTILDVELDYPVPVNKLEIAVNEEIDYYRPVTFQYLHDSVETEKGWQYHYRNISHSTLSSLGKNEFALNTTIANKLRIIIFNQDNQPLDVEQVTLSGNVYEMIGRFSEAGDYQLVYGNKKAKKPAYDVVRFVNKVPEELSALAIGPVEMLKSPATSGEKPPVISKSWLWAVMIVIILLLGWFTLKMIKEK